MGGRLSNKNLFDCFSSLGGFAGFDHLFLAQTHARLAGRGKKKHTSLPHVNVTTGFFSTKIPTFSSVRSPVQLHCLTFEFADVRVRCAREC